MFELGKKSWVKRENSLVYEEIFFKFYGEKIAMCLP